MIFLLSKELSQASEVTAGTEGGSESTGFTEGLEVRVLSHMESGLGARVPRHTCRLLTVTRAQLPGKPF